MHRTKIECTTGAPEVHMEKDPTDEQVRIIQLAKYIKKIPIFPNVYTDLGKIVAAPHAYPQVDLDMEAGDVGVLCVRWFKTASDPSYQELVKNALDRHKEPTARRPRKKR